MINKKVLKTIAVLTVSGCLMAGVIGCDSEETTTTTTEKTATVTRGTLSESIVGTGNLAYSDIQQLAFEMAGYVEEVLVSEGDTVEEGQTLVTLDTSAWEEDISDQEDTIINAKRNLLDAESNLIDKQRQIATKENAVTQAEINLQQAINNLNEISDVASVQDRIDTIVAQIEAAEASKSVANAQSDSAAVMYLTQYIQDLEAQKATVETELQDMLDGTSVNLSSDVALTIETYQLNISQAEISLEEAELAVEDAIQAVSDAELSVEEAEQDVVDAEQDLEDLKALSPVITAPFDGFITSINVQGGDEVQKGTVGVQIADPELLEAQIYITESDIFSVEIGTAAEVSVDVLSDVIYPAEITKISPTATVSSGVVNYLVTVQLTSLTPITSSYAAVTTGTMQMPSEEEMAEMMENVSMDGEELTEEEMEEMQAAMEERMASGEMPETIEIEETDSETITLKDGLSVTVDVVYQQASNVLLVPSKAISSSGGVYSVQLQNGDSSETVQITVGMSDGTQTEVSTGLSEGDVVVYEITTSTSSSSSSDSSSSSSTQMDMPMGGAMGGFGGGF